MRRLERLDGAAVVALRQPDDAGVVQPLGRVTAHRKRLGRRGRVAVD